MTRMKKQSTKLLPATRWAFSWVAPSCGALSCVVLPCVALSCATLSCAAQEHLLQFVYTSDVHYGITRPRFRGADSVPSRVVNEAMIAAINLLPGSRLP